MNLDSQLTSFLVIGIAVAGLTGVATLVLKGMELWRHLKGEPQRRSVAIEEQFATKAELGEIRAQVGRLESSTEQLRRDMHQEMSVVVAKGEDRAVKLHERINALGTTITNDLGTLKGQMGIIIAKNS